MGGETQAKVMATSYPKLVDHPVGQQITGIYTDRLRQFIDGGQYAGQSLPSQYDEGRVSDDKHVKLSVYDVPNLDRPLFAEATKQEFKPTSKGQWFGPSWSTHWFKITIIVPSEFQKKDLLEFRWDTGSEGFIWLEDGTPVHGLTGGERKEWIFPKDWRDGKPHTFYVEMAANGMFGLGNGDTIQPPDMNRYFMLSEADIVAVNVEARQLYFDFWIISDAAREFPGNSWEKHTALQTCNAIMDAFIAGNGSKDAIAKGRKIARSYIGNVDSAKVYESGKQPIVFATGHCHIDTCWLWPWAETKRKVLRSWMNQCDLMDRYPELRFTCSSAQQYKWLETIYPAAFDRVKVKVKAGTFQPIGGSWVEHDTNLPSGESLVRQFITGQRYFESRFGERSSTFWLPDTFGYAAQIPQICRLAGMTRFLTQKLSWNNINKFPHTTFNWVAPDDSQVLCHMPPSETYTADAHFGDVNRSVQQHKSMDQDNTSLLVFGKGDGGGGPTFEHLEKLRRERGLSDTTGLLPRVKMGDSVDDFFARLEKKAENGTNFTTWYGELYFELHRGTYTTQSRSKRNNRKAEIMMYELEMLATLATLRDKKYKYPKKSIDETWENICLMQFHDCLPGSSIHMCYDDSDELYAKVFKVGDEAMQGALSALGWKPSDSGRDVRAWNSNLWDRNEIIDRPNKGLVAVADAKPLGTLQDFKSTGASAASVKEIKSGVFLLENDDLAVTVERGAITSLWDKRSRREVVSKDKKANQIVLFDDKPLYWQAWDVEVFHFASRTELSSSATKIAEQGPERVSVVTETKISEQSSMSTRISLNASVGKGERASYVEVSADVDWHETMKFLKVEFPVDIVNTEASYEMQYGIVKRPTHYNTSWDMAKFEVCCHKWADLSEANYGVSILNDCKYGFATAGKLMRLSLLRAPKAPDETADMGRHTMRWAIMPHAGALSHQTVRAARDFNYPMRLLSPSTSPAEPSLFRAIRLTGDPALILDWVKRAEDDEDISTGELPTRKDGKNVVIRVYDSLGGKTRGRIEWDEKWISVKKIVKTNVLEDDVKEVEMDKGKADIELRAFEIATFRLQY